MSAAGGGGGGGNNQPKIVERDIPISKMIWIGNLDPRTMKTPSSIKTVTLGFMLLLYLYIFAVWYERDRTVHTLSSGTREIIITNCYVEISCSPRESTTFAATVNEVNGTLFVDGSKTSRCNQGICIRNIDEFNARNETLGIRVVQSVVNFAGLPEFVNFPIRINAADQGGNLDVAKVIFANTTFESLWVNITSGLVVLDNVQTESGRIILEFGSVFVNSFFGYPFDVSASIDEGAYCLSSAVSFTTSACTGSGIGCPLNVTHNGGTGNRSSFDITATSLYVNEMNSNTKDLPFAFDATLPRVGGSAMSEAPKLNPVVYSRLNLTKDWAADSTISDYVQAVEVVTPSLGTLFLHARKRITMEVRPEWLAFFSGYALQVHYRRMKTPLSHYRCEERVGRALLAPSSLSSVIVDNEYDSSKQGPYTRDDLKQMIERHFSLSDQATTAEEIFKAADVPNAFVSFTNPEREFSGISEVAGSQWTSYILETDVEGNTRAQPLKSSATATVLIWLAALTALFMCVGTMIVLIKNRHAIVRSLMLIDERDLLRNMVNYRKSCPYHYFASILQISAWIAFRITKGISENLQYPGRNAPFGRFLGYYFTSPKKDKTEGRVDGAKLRTIATDQVYEQYQRWAVLRYVSNEISNELMNKAFDHFGARRYEEGKLVIFGMRARKDVDPKAQFSLMFNALQNFYMVTYAASDTVLFDDVYNRAVAAQASIENETALIRKLRQWKFEVISRPYEVAYNIIPVDSQALAEEKLGPVVAQLEANAYSYPSYAQVEWVTTGSTHKILKLAMWISWVLLEDALILVITVLPILLCFLVTVPLELEHARFTTSTSTIQSSDLGSVLSHMGAPRPQSIPGMVVYMIITIFVVCISIEPWLVWVTYRAVGAKKMSAVHPLRLLLYIRVLLGGSMALVSSVACLCIITYFFNLLIWWVLGAVIEPNRMLVYASSVITTVFVVGQAITNLNSMRQQALDRLKTRILEEMLLLVRRSPAANLFDRFKAEKISVDTGDGAIAHVVAKPPTVTSGVVLDAVSDDRNKQSQAVDIIANSVECPHGILWLGLAVVKRDEKMLSRAVREMMELMDVPMQFEALAQQLTRQIINLPVSSLQLSHALYALVPQYEQTLLEYDDIVVPLVQCALSRTFSDRVLVDALRRIVHEELADRLKVNPMVLRRGFSLGWALKKGDRVQAYKDACGILIDMVPYVPEKPKSLRSLYLCTVEGMKLATGQPHRFVESLDQVVRRMNLDKTPLFEALQPLIQSSEGSSTQTADFNFDRVRRGIEKVIDAENPINEDQDLGDDSSQQMSTSNNVAKIQRVGIAIMQRFARTIALRFQLSPPQVNELLGLFAVMTGDVTALQNIPEELHIRFPLKNILSKAVEAFNKIEGVRKKSLFSSQDDIDGLARSAAKNPHEWLEVWLADQWIAIADLFAFREIRPPACDNAAFAKMVGIPAEALGVFRQLCQIVHAIVKFTFPEAGRFEEGQDESATIVTDPKISRDEVFKLIAELARLLMKDMLPVDAPPLDSKFISRVHGSISKAIVNQMAAITNTDAIIGKLKAIDAQRTQKYMNALESDSDSDTENSHRSKDAFIRSFVSRVAAIFVEHTLAEGTVSDINNKVKKLAITLMEKNHIPVKEIPYAEDCDDVDVFFDDLIDMFSCPYGTGDGDGVDIDWAESIGMEPRILRLLMAPNTLLRHVPGLESVGFLMTILHDVELNRAGASETRLRTVLEELGVQQEDIQYAKLTMLFFSKRGVSLVDEEDEGLATKKRFLKDAYLKAIELRNTNFHDSLITLMYDQLTKDDGTELALPCVIEGVHHYKRLMNFLEYKVFPEDQEDIDYLEKMLNATTKSGQSDATLETRSAASGGGMKSKFQLTICDELLQLVEFHCPHLFEIFKAKEEEFQQQEEERLKKEEEQKAMKLKAAAEAVMAARRFSGVVKSVPANDIGVHDLEGDQEENVELLSRQGATQSPRSPQTRSLSPSTLPMSPSGGPKKMTRVERAQSSGIVNAMKLWRLFEILEKLCDSNPVLDMYIEKVEGDDEDEVSVDEGDIAPEVMDCFQTMSPFELLGPDVSHEYRELFAVMSGYSAWYPTEYSSKFYAACTAAARGPLTNYKTLQVLCTLVPLKYQSFALEMFQLACGIRDAPMLAISSFLDEAVADVEEARDLFIPPTVPELYVALRQNAKRGILGEKNQLERYKWITMLRSAVQGNLYPFLFLDEIKDESNVIKFSFLIATGSYRDILIDMYPDIDAGPLLAQAEEETPGAADFEEAMPILHSKMEEIFLLEDEEDMWMDANELAESKQIRKGIELLLGLFYISNSQFDVAEKHLLTFTGSDELMTPLVDLLLLAARLVVEDGAVNDAQAVIGAMESAARIGCVYFKQNPLTASEVKHVPKAPIFLNDVLPFIADTLLDIYNEYEEGVEDELDPFEEAEAIKKADQEGAAQFAAEALANVADLENIDWLTTEFENLRTIVEGMYDELKGKMEKETQLINDNAILPFADVPAEAGHRIRFEEDRIASLDAKITELQAAQKEVDQSILEQPDEDEEEANAVKSFNDEENGEQSPGSKSLNAPKRPANFNDLFMKLEDMLLCLSSFDKDSIGYVAQLVGSIDALAREVNKNWAKSPQMQFLKKLKLTLELTPELLDSVHNDLKSMLKFVKEAHQPRFKDCMGSVEKVVPRLKVYVKALADAVEDQEAPDSPTPEILADFVSLSSSVSDAYQIVVLDQEDHTRNPHFRALRRDLKKTNDAFALNIELFFVSRSIVPMFVELEALVSYNEQLDTFLEDTIGELVKYLKGRDGSGVRQFLSSMIPLLSSESMSEKQTQMSVDLVMQFVSSIQHVLDSPALETVIEEAVNIFTLVSKIRYEDPASPGSAVANVDTKDSVPLEDLLGAVNAARDGVLGVLGTMDAGNDSGAALFLKLLQLVVSNRQATIKAKKLSASTVPLNSTDLRKLTLLIELAVGNFEILPEVIAATGIGISPEKQQQLIQMIKLIQSIKKIAQKKDLSSLTASDTIDIIATQMFNEFDIEGTGEISLDVFCMALARMQLHLSPQEQRLLFSKADKDQSGFVTQSEFRAIIDEIQDRFRARMIQMMGLSKETIYLTSVWITLFLVFLFAFVVLGTYAFSDGTNFTAAITGLLPMAAGLVTQMKDPNGLLRLLQLADLQVKEFFEILSEV